MKSQKIAVLVLVVGMLFYGAKTAQADQITFTESADASGSLGSQGFTDALVTITLIGDTADVSTEALGVFVDNVGVEGTVTVAGVGTANFTDSMTAFVNQNTEGAGIHDSSVHADVLDTGSAEFDTYDLTSNFGPITGPSKIMVGTDYGTSLGTLDFTSAGDSTFTAAVAAEVPEPASMVLVSTGLLGLAGFAKRKFFS